MSKDDIKIKHITQTDGNVFADLSFDPEKSAKLKIRSQLMIKISK